MPTFDIFNGSAFQSQTLTVAVNNMPYKPQMLGNLNLFAKRRIRTVNASIESKNNTLSLIQTSPRGAPIEELDRSKRNIRDFRTVRLAKGSTLYADEIQGVRAFGSETELQQVQDMVTSVISGDESLLNDMELTKENMRLGAIQGIILDADGSTITNWYDEFAVTQPAEIDFDLDNATPASGALKKKCTQVIRAMMKAATGSWTPMTQVFALCGDAFYDDLSAHPEVVDNRKGVSERESEYLRNLLGAAYDTTKYGSIVFVNYRGTDDGTSVAIATNDAKFFPVNATGVFVEALSPAEFLPFVNTPGQDFYSLIVRDTKRDAWVRPEIYSYPLHICTRPLMLQRGRRT